MMDQEVLLLKETSSASPQGRKPLPRHGEQQYSPSGATARANLNVSQTRQAPPNPKITRVKMTAHTSASSLGGKKNISTVRPTGMPRPAISAKPRITAL